MLRVGDPDRLNIALFLDLRDHPTVGNEPTGNGDPNVSPPRKKYVQYADELTTLVQSVGTRICPKTSGGPTDGTPGTNPNRLEKPHQRYQVRL